MVTATPPYYFTLNHFIKVKYIRIDDKDEIKPPRHQRSGAPSTHSKGKYADLQSWIEKFYLNHGNNMAHTLGLVTNQLNKKGDEKVFTKDGRSLNRFISRGLYFSKSCSNLYRLKKPQHRTPGKIKDKLQYYFTPVLYLYDKEPIEQMIDDGKGILYDGTIPSYSHEGKPKTFEYRMNHAKELPDPKYIIVGKSHFAAKKDDRYDINIYLDKIKNIYPNVTIIHIPHIAIGLTKKKRTTGNTQTPLTGLRMMEILKNYEEGKYNRLPSKIIEKSILNFIWWLAILMLIILA